MRHFLLGLAFGVVLAGSVAAIAAEIVGVGALSGWTVTQDGEEVCTDPVINGVAHTIQCPSD